jgi:hypothetical protein
VKISLILPAVQLNTTQSQYLQHQHTCGAHVAKVSHV